MEFNPEAIGGQTIPPGDADLAIQEPAPISTKTALAYSSGSAGAGIFYALNLYALTLFLGQLGAPDILNSLLSSTHSFEGTFIQPVVGAWSDRTWNARFGRRRIFIVRFLPIAVVLLIGTPFIPALNGILSHTGILIAVGVAIFLFSVAFNIMFDPYTALLADITPQAQRGRINSVFQAVGAGGQVLFLLLSLVLGLVFNVNYAIILVGAAVLIALSFIPSITRIREPRTLPGLSRTHRYSARDYWNGVRSDPQVLRYYLTQLLLWIGINAISVNITRYATRVLGLSDTLALVLPLVLLISTSLTYLPLIRLVDRIGLKPLFVGGIVLMSAAALGAIFTTNVVLTCVLLAVAGMGNAAQTVSSFPLLTRVTFPDQMGLYTGLNTAVTSVSAPLSAVIAGVLTNAFTFKALFPFLAVMFLLTLIPLALLQVERSKAAQAFRAMQPSGAALAVPIQE
jgi:maltose/moltooligosaccharide transporter